MSTIRIQALPKFPADVEGGDGIIVTRSGGVFTFSLDPLNAPAILGFVPDTKTITAGAGLTGGGDFSANRTFAVGAGTGITVNADDVALSVPVSVANGGTGGTTQATAQAALGLRPRATGALNIFVRKDGNDANTGLVDNASGAKLTIQAGLNLAASLDANGQVITITVRAGTYTEDLALPPVVGSPFGGFPILEGDTSTPSNVVIAGTSKAILGLGYMNDWLVTGFKITSGGYGVHAHAGTWIRLGVIDFGVCTTVHGIADQNGVLELQSAYTISGNAPFHTIADTGGYVLNAGVLVTLTGTPAFGGAFAYAANSGRQNWSGATFSGSATGPRYNVSAGGIIHVGSAAVSTFFPGNSAVPVGAGGRISGTTFEQALGSVGAVTATSISNASGGTTAYDYLQPIDNLANNGTVNLNVPATQPFSWVEIINKTGGYGATFFLRGTAADAQEGLDLSSQFSVTPGTAGTNVYANGGTYVLQNKTGGAASYAVHYRGAA